MGNNEFEVGKLTELLESWVKVAIEADKRMLLYKKSLEEIRSMRLKEGESDYKYAFNRCWHIATNALINQLNKTENK